MLTDEQEKLAFFQLLDEYFNSRPQFAGLFEGSPHAAAPAPAPAAARNHAPVAPAASRPVPAAPAGLGTATALYDFEGTQAEDLPFRTGDVISITEIGAFLLPRGSRVVVALASRFDADLRRSAH